jgi:tetratricopeptide (TPR) repeat protein
MNKMSYSIIAILAFAASGNLYAANNYCGELRNHYGPYDYRDRASGKLEIVENAHFTPDVENGIRGNTSSVGGDLDYTLRAIPNHHRALTSMGNVSINTKTPQLYGARFPAECYFERAIRFVPDDGLVRALYGIYLNRRGRFAEALSMFKAAIDREPNNPTINYNLGLLYLKMKQYDKASEYADKAYELGFPLNGLRNQLAEARKGSPAGK